MVILQTVIRAFDSDSSSSKLFDDKVLSTEKYIQPR